MSDPAFAPAGAITIPVVLVGRAAWDGDAPAGPSEAQRRFATAAGFRGGAGDLCALPGPDGTVGAILFGTGDGSDPFVVGKLATGLPDGDYRLDGTVDDIDTALLAFALGAYRFGRYREAPPRAVRLQPPPGIDVAEVARIAGAVRLGRDLVNMPANDLGPDGIEDAARALAARHGARIDVTTGEALLGANLPMIHAVGRAAERAPRLIDISWGRADAPRVTIVGKGVAFDTGGLDIKPSASMLLMKKDMGGAAAALALADMVMGAGLDLRLRVLVPAVENSVSAGSFRPGDVLRSRKGLTVEIGNTDAEGRLVLADALALADEEEPDLAIDFATLTGAARVALGPDLPALFTADDELAADLARTGAAVRDPLWRMPLWAPYAKGLESKIADLNNVSSGPFAGAVTAALFLSRFVERARAYAHVDLYAWNPVAKPGRPEGGEVQAARAAYGLLRERYPAAG